MTVLSLADRSNKTAEAQAAVVAELERLVEKAKAGELTQIVGMYVINDCYEYFRGNASFTEAIAMCAMAQTTAVERMKAS